MPKNVQRQKAKSTELSEKYSPSTVYLKVLGTGAQGAPSSLYLFSDHKRYLFNCGEGTQRLAHEHKVKLSKLEHIFITNKTWINLGGLPGVSLTLQDVGVPEITLHGPPGLDILYQATRRFIGMKDMKVNTAICDSSHDFEDNIMNVKYVLLGPEETYFSEPHPPSKKQKLQEEDMKNEFLNDETDYYGNENATSLPSKKQEDPKKEKPKIQDTFARKSEKVIEDLKKMPRCSVAYICKLKKRLGTLSLVKCLQMGLKPGPFCGRLKNGEDVVLENGKVVRSKDVKAQDEPGPIFIVLEVPDISYLREKEFKLHYDDGENPAKNIPSLVVHFTPPHVIKDVRYQSFLKMFGPTTEHLIINKENTCQGLVAVHKMQQKLSLIKYGLFPSLKNKSIPIQWDDTSKVHTDDQIKVAIAIAQLTSLMRYKPRKSAVDKKIKDETLVPYHKSRTLTTYYFRPHKGLDRASEPFVKTEEYITETLQAEGVAESIKEYKTNISSMEIKNDYPNMVFLGTGSSMASKTRNTSGIILHLDKSHSIILDCGEGTFGQLVRFYGNKGIADIMRTLKAVYVSHLHADHHIGLISLLQARQKLLGNITPVYLLAPGQIMAWLSVYDQQFESIREQFHLVANSTMQRQFEDGKELTTNGVSAVIAEAIGLAKVETCLVSHCPNAFGVALTTPSGVKITYSGDSIPCDNLVYLGKDSDLLIHEATFEDELADEARLKMHSTSSQAVQVGRDMGAKFVILTHFSPRYVRLPRLNSLITDAGNVGIAFDNMEVSLGMLPLLPQMFKPLQLMFAEYVLKLEAKAAKRNLQKERSRSAVPVVDMPTADKIIKPAHDERPAQALLKSICKEQGCLSSHTKVPLKKHLRNTSLPASKIPVAATKSKVPMTPKEMPLTERRSPRPRLGPLQFSPVRRPPAASTSSLDLSPMSSSGEEERLRRYRIAPREPPKTQPPPCSHHFRHWGNPQTNGEMFHSHHHPEEKAS